jgi:fused signal recognition particle receptor
MLRNLFRQVSDLFSGAGEVSDDLFDELEEVLVASDVSATLSAEIVSLLREAARERGIRTADEVRDLLRAHIAGVLDEHAAPLALEAAAPPLFYLVVGVNGTGKTTTIAKLGARFQRREKKVLLAAADTFRAAGSARTWFDTSLAEIPPPSSSTASRRLALAGRMSS